MNPVILKTDHCPDYLVKLLEERFKNEIAKLQEKMKDTLIKESKIFNLSKSQIGYIRNRVEIKLSIKGIFKL